jgi:hypothetical protein
MKWPKASFGLIPAVLPIALSVPAAAPAGAAGRAIPCAIRWDAVDTGIGNPINTEITRTLAPATFWSRAPWYAKPLGAGGILIDGDSQAIMDREIAYAHDAGLTCWVYLWYGANHAMQNAWRLHQSSSRKNDVNWAQMAQFGDLKGSGNFSSQTPAIIGYMEQSNYQTVLAGRPLWFLYADGSYASHLAEDWGNDPATFASALATFRAAAEAAGLPNPYIVMVNGDAAVAASLGTDAVSSYVPDFGPDAPAKPWTKVAAAISSYWSKLGSGASAAGIQTVPIVATGWDTRPRKLHIVSWETSIRKPGEDPNVYDVLPTPAQFAAELQNAVKYVADHRSVAASNVILIYAWDECDEGGNCLIPHYDPANPGVPDTAILDALRTVNWQAVRPD